MTKTLGRTKEQTQALKVVVVGCGRMARAWIETALAMKNVALVGLVDLHRAAAETRAAEFKLPMSMVFDSLAEAVKQTGAKMVFDVTIPAAHAAVTLEALGLGCHVIGEKPLSDNMVDAKKMVAAAKRNGLTYAVMQNRRYIAEIRALSRLLRSGKIGDVQEVHSDFFLEPHFGGFRDEMAFPLLIDMAIHSLDQARLIADADPVSVYCHSFNPAHSWYKGDASAQCIFEMKSRAGQPLVYNYRGSWCAGGMNTSWQCDWRVICSKGTAMWDGEQSLRVQKKKPAKNQAFVKDFHEVAVPVKAMKHQAHDGLIRAAVAAIAKGEVPETVCTDNIKSLAMVLGAIESAKTGKKVKIRV